MESKKKLTRQQELWGTFVLIFFIVCFVLLVILGMDSMSTSGPTRRQQVESEARYWNSLTPAERREHK